MSQKSILSFFSKKEPINISPKCNNTEINDKIDKCPVTVESESPGKRNGFATSSKITNVISPPPINNKITKKSKRLRIESSSSSSSDGDNNDDNAEDNKNKNTNKKNSPPKKKDRLTITKEKSKSPNKEICNDKKNTDQLDKTDIKPNGIEQKKEIESTPPSPADKKQIPTMFLTSTKKQMKVQSVGEGHTGADYDPSKRNYDPITDAFWKHGEKVPYLALTRTFSLIEDISSRLRMIEVFSNFLRSVIVLSPLDLVSCVYLSLNQLAPAYEGLELGLAETTLMKVIAQTTGRTLAQVKQDAQTTGDLGIVAERSKSNQRLMFVPAPLMVATVFTKLKEIAKMSGSASMGKKSDKIQSIFVSCRHSEARFFIRSLLGKLRIGLAEQSLLQALSLACTLTPANQKEFPPTILNSSKGQKESKFKVILDANALQVKSAYCQCPNYDRVIEVLQTHGIGGLAEHCVMVPGTPLKPMLAHPTKGVSEVLQRFDGLRFTCEYKYDGERAQIHLADTGTVNIYSRNQENNTGKYPDIIARIADFKLETVRSCILDCEAVAWDTERQQILPFQVLTTRKRKDANESEITVQVCVFMFDLLYLNGEPLITLPFIERRKLLHTHFREIAGIWKFATSLDTNDIDELQQFLDESVHGNCEGLMIKTLDHEATYEIAKRSRNWLKLKKDYLSGIGDSLDLVVIGGYRGRGKRSGNYGGYLLACYDQENEEYQSICKIGTGFSDEILQTHSNYFEKNIIPKAKSYYRYDSSHEPDEWFEPMQVWEVKCADLSLSPVHKAAMGIIDAEKGISLRFPRFIRIRDDKKCEDATSAQQVADMYSNQDQIKNQTSSKNVEDDFY